MRLRPATIAILELLSDDNAWLTKALARSVHPCVPPKVARSRLGRLRVLGFVEQCGVSKQGKRWGITDEGQAWLNHWRQSRRMARCEPEQR